MGQIAIAHNGNLTNAMQLRDELEGRGAMFQTTVDSEIILHLLAQPTLGKSENNLIQTMRRLEGAYSLVIMTRARIDRRPRSLSGFARSPSARSVTPGSWPAKPAPSI